MWILIGFYDEDENIIAHSWLPQPPRVGEHVQLFWSELPGRNGDCYRAEYEVVNIVLSVEAQEHPGDRQDEAEAFPPAIVAAIVYVRRVPEASLPPRHELIEA